MRPGSIESLRAIQGAIADALTPEIKSLYAQEAAQAVTMMVESLAAELDTAVADLTRDNDTLRRLLNHAAGVLRPAGESNAAAATVVNEIEETLAGPAAAELTITATTQENDRLRSALASLLEYVEDQQGEPDGERLAAVRNEAYRYLRVLALSGWSFFDVSGFRERIVQARAEQPE